MEHAFRAQLPETELGSDRCLEIGYFGHGDITVTVWHGALDEDPEPSDNDSGIFRFAHGSDAMLLASLAGFLNRSRENQNAVQQILTTAGSDILADSPDTLRGYHSFQSDVLSRIVRGDPFPTADLPEHGLQCLLPPVPAQPGHLEQVGGTGLYTRANEKAPGLLLVLGKYVVTFGSGPREVALETTEDFCTLDVPVIAQLICEVALGEYRRDLHALLAREFTETEQADDDDF